MKPIISTKTDSIQKEEVSEPFFEQDLTPSSLKALLEVNEGKAIQASRTIDIDLPEE